MKRIQSIYKNVVRYTQDLSASYYGHKLNRLVDTYRVDFRIYYPCYKSMDEFIDVKRLIALDTEIVRQIQAYIKQEIKADEFKSGPMKWKFWCSQTTTSRLIPLTIHRGAYRYEDINKPDMWEPTVYTEQFSFLMNFIKTLPFKKTARIMLMFDLDGSGVTIHRDHAMQNVCHHFIWFRTNLSKKFFLYDKNTKQKKVVSSYSAWFDTVNQYHGVEKGEKGLNFSIRVDGIFTDEFLQLIPVPPFNLASTPAFWACLQ